MNIEAIIKELNSTGWMILSLHQYSQMLWGCKLHKKKPSGASEDFYIEVCEGKSILDALQAALVNSKQVRNTPVKPATAKPAPAAAFLPGLTNVQSRAASDAFDALTAALKHYQSARCPAPKL